MKFNMSFKKYGIGNSIESNFKKEFGLNLRKLKARPTYLTNKIKTTFNLQTINLLKDKKLFRNIRKNIEFHKNIIKSYKGTRHRRGYPVRGQRTHTNATRKVSKRIIFA